MSKGNSNLFHGTFGTSVSGLTQPLRSYSDRGIEIPENVRSMLEKLPKKGSFIKGSHKDFTIRDVSIMSKETGVEFAKVTIGDESYLIRGDQFGATIPPKIKRLMRQKHSSFDFHSHPHDDDLMPSQGDMALMRQLRRWTGQLTSTIVTPNGKTLIYNERGTICTGTVPNTINEDLRKMYISLFGGDS